MINWQRKKKTWVWFTDGSAPEIEGRLHYHPFPGHTRRTVVKGNFLNGRTSKSVPICSLCLEREMQSYTDSWSVANGSMDDKAVGINIFGKFLTNKLWEEVCG